MPGSLLCPPTTACGAGHKRGWQIKDTWEQRAGERLMLVPGVALAKGEPWCEAHTQVSWQVLKAKF